MRGRVKEWFGIFEQKGAELISCKPDYPDSKEYQGRPLRANVADIAPDMSHSLHRVDATVVDLLLDRPIDVSVLGWLRLNLSPETWPGHSVTALPSLDFLEGPHEFLARISIVSPKLFRHDLQQRVKQHAPGCVHKVIDKGWLTPGTLTRVLDHRITLVADATVQLSQIMTSLEPKPIVAVEPFPIGDEGSSTGGSYFGQTFLTGSKFNDSRDVVQMANRICEYIVNRPLPPDVNDGILPISVDELVTHFGGSAQEAVEPLSAKCANKEF